MGDPTSQTRSFQMEVPNYLHRKWREKNILRYGMTFPFKDNPRSLPGDVTTLLDTLSPHKAILEIYTALTRMTLKVMTMIKVTFKHNIFCSLHLCYNIVYSYIRNLFDI